MHPKISPVAALSTGLEHIQCTPYIKFLLTDIVISLPCLAIHNYIEGFYAELNQITTLACLQDRTYRLKITTDSQEIAVKHINQNFVVVYSQFWVVPPYEFHLPTPLIDNYHNSYMLH